jgi:hypothetical protein
VIIMGVAPPPNFPPPAEQDQDIVDAGFKPSPTGASLCGFGLPVFFLSIKIPGFKFPPFDFPPKLNLSLSLNCDLSNPIDAELSFGGGRVSQQDPDPDDVDP